MEKGTCSQAACEGRLSRFHAPNTDLGFETEGSSKVLPLKSQEFEGVMDNGSLDFRFPDGCRSVQRDPSIDLGPDQPPELTHCGHGESLEPNAASAMDVQLCTPMDLQSCRRI